jgi:hypothetical protein
MRNASDIPGATEFFTARARCKDDPEALLALSEEHSETLKRLGKREAEYNQLLSTSLSVDLLTLPLALFPEETEIDLTPLLPIIEDKDGADA